jgi:hypothetical protein
VRLSANLLLDFGVETFGMGPALAVCSKTQEQPFKLGNISASMAVLSYDAAAGENGVSLAVFFEKKVPAQP